MDVRFGLWRKLSSKAFKEIQPVHSKGDQPWMFFGRNDAKAETPVLWPPRVKSWLIGKHSDVGRDWGQEEKGTTEDEMAGWHHRLDGSESEWTLGVGDGQGGLEFCDSWGRKESDTTERLIWSELSMFIAVLFTIAKRWKQSKCLSMDEWIKCCKSTMGCYSAIGMKYGYKVQHG